MERAWEIEREFWSDSATSGPLGWVAKYMASDGFVVMPSGVLSRDALVIGWQDRPLLRSWSVSEPVFTMVEGGNLVISYEARLDAEWLPDYEAFVTALYIYESVEWSLICRAHTPKGRFPL
jgi:hypothetical protein